MDTLVHLAGKGTVLSPAAAVPGMLNSGPVGLVNLLEEFRPRRVVLASSCAVYGNAPRSGAAPGWSNVHPVSAHGLIKAMSELLLRQHCSGSGATGVVLRFGNIVGPGCKGLIALLIRHALSHPGGAEPVRMRGGGRVLRDYVPIGYTVAVLRRSLELAVKSGAVVTYNLGSGHPLTNRHVAEVVAEWLLRRGYQLNVAFDPELGAGEAWSSVLRVERTARTFGVPSPSPEQVRQAIVAGAESVFEAFRSGGRARPSHDLAGTTVNA